jgi:hypothetical protein
MARKSSLAKAPTELLQKTRFIVYRTAQGYWIASTKDGRVTGAFPVPAEGGPHGAPARPARRS